MASEGKKTNQLGNLRSKQQHNNEFPCNIYFRLSAEETSNLEMPTSTDQKKKKKADKNNKSPLSLGRGPGKRQPSTH